MVGFDLGTLCIWVIRCSVLEFRPKRSQPCPFLRDRRKMGCSWMHPWMNDVSHGRLVTVEGSSEKFHSYLEVWNLFEGSLTRCHATIIFILYPRLHSTSFHISYITLNVEWKSHYRARRASGTLCKNKNPIKRPSSPGVLLTQWLDHSGVLEVVGSILTWKFENFHFLHTLPSNHHLHISLNTDP